MPNAYYILYNIRFRTQVLTESFGCVRFGDFYTHEKCELKIRLRNGIIV